MKLFSGWYKFLVGFQSFLKAHSDSFPHSLLACGKEGMKSYSSHSAFFGDIIAL